MAQKMSWAQIKSQLDATLANHKRVDEAPNFSELHDAAWLAGQSIGAVMRKEEEVLYKSSDGEGNVYLMHNPALLTWQMSERINPVVRTKPRLMSSNGSQNNSSKNNSWDY